MSTSSVLTLPPSVSARRMARLRSAMDKITQIKGWHGCRAWQNIGPYHDERGSGRMRSVLAYVVAAVAEMVGCFSLCAWLRLHKSAWWVVPGMLSLALF